MGNTATRWGSLPLALYILELAWSLEANGSSALFVPRIDAEYRLGASKNYSTFRTGQPSAEFLGKHGFSQKKFLFTNILPVGQNEESFDGFEFVDSPEIPTDAPPDKADKPNGAVRRVNSTISDDPPIRDNNNGAIEKNLWKSYPNGTIIHDVHISLVHPANMVGMVNEGNPGSSAPVESEDSSGREVATREGRSSPEPRSNQSVIYDANNATMIPFESAFRDDDSSAFADSRSEAYSVNDSTALPPTADTNTSTVDAGPTTGVENGNSNASSFAAGQMNLNGKFPPVINLGISINAKGPCLSECLSKCYTAESSAGINREMCLPSCWPRLVSLPVKGGLDGGSGSFPDETNASTASLPVLPLDEKGDESISNLDMEFASGIDIGMLKVKDSAEPKLGFLLEDICLSESCVLKAADILKRMEKSVDPCDSFYKFACGGYFKNEIPDGESSRSVFSDISSDIIARMYTVLKSPLLANDYPPVKLLKKFYGKCMHTSPKELFMDALKVLGGWPSPYSPSHRVPQRTWGEIAFNWTHGMFLEYNLVSINLTFASERDEWMLNVDYPRFVKVALNSDSLSVLDEMERDIRIVASALGIDNSTTASVLLDLRIFMTSAIKYAKATVSRAEKGVLSLKDLKARFIHLDVLKQLPSLLKTVTDIDDNEMVYVSNMMYLWKIDGLLRDSTVRTQANHLVLTALRTLLVLIGTATDVMEKYCVKLTGKLFPHLFGHLYSSAFVSNSKVASATRIISQVRASLLNMLGENINETAKGKVIDKVSKLMFIWSNRNDVSDDLNGIARSLDENPSFSGFVKTGIWNLKKVTYAYLHQRVNSSLASFIERYSEDGYGVNAFYYSEHVLIPSSALHENIFDPGVPLYVSFGGLGLIVGHELLHSLIAAGDISNSVNYRNVEKCMIKQFNKFTKKYSAGRVNGILTKKENIADYGGFKVAYQAFMEWYNHSSKESKGKKRLPGLQKFNEKQMFWLTAAANWCQKVSPNIVSTSVDKHAPPEFRIDGQFANIPEFAQDFNCPENSPMNPKEKCSLW